MSGRAVTATLAFLTIAASAAAGGSTLTNGRIFFVQKPDEVGMGTFVNPDGSGEATPVIRRVHGDPQYLVADLAGTQNVEDAPVSFSPDGKSVATTCPLPLRRGVYYGTNSRKELRTGICVQSVNGGGSRVLVRPPQNTDQGDFDPAWSRDGSRIVFVRSARKRKLVPAVCLGPGGTYHCLFTPVTHYLYLINVNGSGLRQLPVPPRCVTKTRYGATTKLERPDWGPSGELLFVCHRTEGVESATVMLAPDPQQPAREICKSNDLVDARLQLSPDGTQVLAGLAEPEVFPATPSAGACDLEPVFPDGVPGTDQEGEAVWSPDGRWVAWPLQPYSGPHSEQLWLGRADDGSGARAILTVHCSQNTSQCVHGLTSLAWLPQ